MPGHQRCIRGHMRCSCLGIDCMQPAAFGAQHALAAAPGKRAGAAAVCMLQLLWEPPSDIPLLTSRAGCSGPALRLWRAAAALGRSTQRVPATSASICLGPAAAPAGGRQAAPPKHILCAGSAPLEQRVCALRASQTHRARMWPGPLPGPQTGAPHHISMW